MLLSKKNTSKILLVIGLLVSVQHMVYAEITSIGSAINKAGRQRMLSQRMLKAYVMIGIDVQEDVSRKKLVDAISLYDTQLAELKKFAPNPVISNSIDDTEKLWLEYRSILQQPVSRKNAEWLLKNNDALLNASHRIVMLLEEESASSYGKLVNISGRQRMLSQRLAKFYMLRVWGFDNTELRQKENQARTEFNQALVELMAARENSDDIKNALHQAKQQWDLFEYGLERNSEKLVPLIVALTSEKVLMKMNEITAMYEKLSER